MIISINPPGKNMQGMVAYLRDTSGIHRDPYLLTGSIGYTGSLEDEELAELLGDDLDLPAVLNRSRVPAQGHVWNAAMVLAKEDGLRALPEWKNITDEYMTKVGYNEREMFWAAVHHGPNAAGQDHVHILMNKVQFSGIQVPTYKDMKRSSKIAWELEDKYGLTPMMNRRTGSGSRMYFKNDHQMAKREGREPRKVELERRVRAAASAARTRDDFVKNLTKDDLKYRPRKDTNGKEIGYSVQPSGVPSKYWWAGSTLAADLSLPRLEQRWATAPTATPTHVSAIEELVQIRTKAPTSSIPQLTDMAHQLSNALAAASRTTEPVPGPLASESRKVGAIAQTRIYQPGHRPPALSAGFLFLQCTDPTGPVGKAVMIQQMLAASRAVLDAHLARARAAAPSTEGHTRVTQAPEEEITEMAVTVGATVGAMAIERHARNRTERKGWEAEPFTAESIAKFRIQDEVAKGLEKFQAPAPLADIDTKHKLIELSNELEIPMGDAIGKMTQPEAESFVRKLEYAKGHPVSPTEQRAAADLDAEKFLSDLEDRAAQRGTLSSPAPAATTPVIPLQKTEVQISEEAQKRMNAARAHTAPSIKSSPLTPAVADGQTNSGPGVKYTRHR